MHADSYLHKSVLAESCRSSSLAVGYGGDGGVPGSTAMLPYAWGVMFYEVNVGIVDVHQCLACLEMVLDPYHGSKD